MKLVVDANILIAALLRDSTTRRLLVAGGHDLHAPEYLFDEIETHRDELSKRSGQTTEALEEARSILRAHVTEHEESVYGNELEKANSLLAGRDAKDVPYVALALALTADGIWSEDRGLVSLGGLAVYRTSDLVRVGLRGARRE
ncbi:MAG: PIN domain-containing protein [Methanobacteriota archaeon]|nr:MAG: PIN domain-containing protein [Euryarchaeota archaeon]